MSNERVQRLPAPDKPDHEYTNYECVKPGHHLCMCVRCIIFVAMKKILLLAFVSMLLWRCNNDPETDECVPGPTNAPEIVLEFESLQDTIASLSTRKEVVDFLTNNPNFRDYILRRNEYPDDSAFVREMYLRFTNPAIDTLVMETERVFGDLSDLKSQFTEAFSNIKAYYPDFVPPKIQTVISGLDTDLFLSDSLIIVSLDFYLGEGAKYRPKYYEYLLRRYDPEDIVPSCILIKGIGPLNKTNLSDKTVLADMISYGKSFYFAKQVLPCVPDSVFLWYTAEEMKGARENEDMIWARLIEDKVIYSTSMIDKRNYLGERPFTIQVGEKCPGRIAQWVGWRIVKQYMKSHPETTLPQLMSIDDAQELFRQSRYKPKRR
jgi:hypothetical protein